MERKFFFEPLIMYIGGILIFHVGYYCMFPWLIWLTVESYLQSNEVRYIFAGLFLFLVFISSIWVNRTVVRPRIDYFVVAEDYAEWHGLFRRKKRLYYRDCPFVDIETFNKEAQCDIVRGDECAMIYLSTEPYPEDKRGRINHVYCSDTFIKFRYTDKLAEALLEVLPEDKATMIRAFYKGMKHKDEMLERERKERKKRRRRK